MNSHNRQMREGLRSCRSIDNLRKLLETQIAHVNNIKVLHGFREIFNGKDIE